jgi:translocation and assembly module TamB
MWCWSVAAVAQEEQEERSRFIRFVERQISTPDRQIRLGDIEGALSSDVRIEDITIADREGVWLRIEDVRLIWSRRALLSRRLEIELLEAERIAVTRAPLPAEGAPEPFEEPDFQLPELPVVLQVDAVRVQQVEIAPGVLSAQDYELSVAGSVELEGGALDADLDIARTDGSGALALEAAFSNETRVLELDFLLTEPENGIVANLLNLEGRPAVTFAITGVGPIANFVADIALTADGEEVLAGEAGISRTTAGGFRFLADVGGDLQRLVPPLYRELVEAGSRLKIDATRAENGAIDIAEGRAALGRGASGVQRCADRRRFSLGAGPSGHARCARRHSHSPARRWRRDDCAVRHHYSTA